MSKRVLFAALAWLLSLALPAYAAGLQHFAQGSVEITTGSGVHRITVELATTEEQREQGLMFRPTLGKDAGMLFLYSSEQPISMWMKNTLIPLDMLFISGDGTIVHMRERAVPQSLETISSMGLVKAALELNGGTVARLGIKDGDKVIGEGLGQ
jgi:uncharacterized membrane protein (UPF0127 family)